jgi:hypothetical protein
MTIEDGRARIAELEKLANEKHGSGRLSGMYSDGKIGWKINTDKGIVYKSSPDTISDEGVLTMVEDAMKTGPVALHAATPKTTLGKVGDKVWGRSRAARRSSSAAPRRRRRRTSNFLPRSWRAPASRGSTRRRSARARAAARTSTARPTS